MADPLSIAASIIAVVQLSNAVLSYCYRFHMQAKDADKDIFQVIAELEDLRTILNQVQEVLPRPPAIKTETEKYVGTVSTVARSDTDFAGLDTSLKASSDVLADISEKLSPLLRKGLLARLRWPFESKTIQEKVDKLQKQKMTFQLFLSIQHAKILGKQSQDILEQKVIVGKVREHSDKTRRTTVLNWYKTSDPEQNHKICRASHQPATCAWVFETEIFQSWSQGDGEHLWIHGIPGAGKTIICSTIIDYMEKECEADPVARVLYYYFDFGDGKKQSLGNFLQSLIYQLLAANSDELAEPAALLYDKHHGLQDPNVNELFDVFTSIVSNFKTFIMIDALDECSKQERELFFDAFAAKLGAKASLLVTSRREPDIEKTIGTTFQHKISIQDAKVDEDVRLHITKAIETDPAFKTWTSAAVKKEVLDAIVKGSRGMYCCLLISGSHT
ncbi:hypothetical protein H072_11050 [Dactylellina haptotyla CBS 200.50]|uniref:Nephrocystin 3-like N-terminal domain-containing protein n=1 Tax=Dactylellina haptotyla (strain CBS 200.50) TaxID=1284197 RepID=S8B8W3_DACHA|nr:hypothetical protein H072_11050 [Dactylellina haptotyla CBS 200.50]